MNRDEYLKRVDNMHSFTGIPSYWMEPRDLDASTESLPVYLCHCLLGHHGLLSHMPVLLLAVLGCGLACRQLPALLRLAPPPRIPPPPRRAQAAGRKAAVGVTRPAPTVSLSLRRFSWKGYLYRR